MVRAVAIGLAVVCLLIAGISASAANAPFRGALWHVVHRLCLTDKKLTGLSAPCTFPFARHGIKIRPCAALWLVSSRLRLRNCHQATDLHHQ